jgi:hypothetical protein
MGADGHVEQRPCRHGVRDLQGGARRQRLADHVECRGANGASPSGPMAVVRDGSLGVRLSADGPHANGGVLAYPQRPWAACPPPYRDRAFRRSERRSTARIAIISRRSLE